MWNLFYLVLIAIIFGCAGLYLVLLGPWGFKVLGILVVLVGISIGNVIVAPDNPESGE